MLGTKVTLIAQLAPGSSTGGQLLLWAKSPSSWMPLRWSGARPLLASRMVSAGLVVPTFWANVSDCWLKVAAAWARLPVNGTDCEVPPLVEALPPASSLTVRVPVRVVMSSGASGLRMIVIWQLLCAAITAGQLLLWEKSGLVPGSSPIELMCNSPLPLFVIVTRAGAGVPLIG